MEDLEKYQRFLARRLLKDLGPKVGAEAEKQGLTEEKLFEELDQTRLQVFEERYAGVKHIGLM